MADSKYANLARKQEFHENDPFAELTRIIGFEPESARPGSEAGQGIDLERELMGEFDNVDSLDGLSFDADAFVWDADEAESEQDVPPAANDAEAGDEQDDAACHAEDGETAGFEMVEEPAIEELTLAEEPAAEEAEDEDFAFDAALDAELSREAESWVFEDAEAEPVADLAAEEPTELQVEELQAEEPEELSIEIGEIDIAAEEFDLEPVEGAAPVLAEADAWQDEEAPAETVAEPRAFGEAALAAEELDPDFLDMDFAALEEVEKLVEDVALEAAVAEVVSEPVNAAPAPIAGANIEDELSALLGSLPPPETQDAGEQLRHDPVDYDFSDILADAPAEPQVAALQDEVEAAAADWQPDEEAAWALEEALAEEIEPAAEAAGEPSWQAGDDVAASEPAAEADILDDLAAEVAAQEPAAPAPAGRDPFAELAAMAAVPMPHFSRVNLSPVAAPRTPEPLVEQAYSRPAAPAEPVAEVVADENDVLSGIDSIEIPEAAVAVADDLDLPEVDYQEKGAPAEFDEFDHDLHGLFTEQQPAEQAAQPSAVAEPTYSEDELRAAVERAFEEEEPLAVRPYEPAAAATVSAAAVASAFPQAGTAAPQAEADPEPDFNFDDAFGYDPEFEEPQPAARGRQGILANRRNLMMAAAAVVGVVIVGGVGSLFIGGEGSESSNPVLVRADEGPFKVRPENPGGSTVPNQNREVYERVTSGPDQTPPVQEKLVSTTEEPIDVATRIPALPSTPPAAEAPETAASLEELAAAPVEELAGAEPADTEMAAADAGSPPPMVEDFTIPMKSEERLAPTPTAEEEAAASDIALVTPRKVQTFVVRPDGTMVPNEAPVQEVSLRADEDSAAAAIQQAEPAQPLEATPAAAEAAAPTEAAPALPTASEAAAAEAVGAIVTPARVPVAPPRPAEQPVEIVGEVRNEQVAAAQPQAPAPAAAAGGWSMQIASQPSAESAQATYTNLASRYGEVIGGRGVNIVKADVTGKGTYYRVRVPAGSRAEAIDLCERYKSAGGSCFVSQ